MTTPEDHWGTWLKRTSGAIGTTFAVTEGHGKLVRLTASRARQPCVGALFRDACKERLGCETVRLLKGASEVRQVFEAVFEGCLCHAVHLPLSQRGISRFQALRLQPMRFAIADMPVPMAYATYRIIRDCNMAFADLFERPRDEIIDRSFARLYPRVSDFVRIGEMWVMHLSGSRRYYDERIMKTASGRPFWCAVNGRSRTPENPFAEAIYCFQPMVRPVDESQSMLSERRRQILTMVSQGKTNGDIALELALSKRTVEAHRARIMRKIGVRNTAELIAWFSKQPPKSDDANWDDGSASPGRVPFLI